MGASTDLYYIPGTKGGMRNSKWSILNFENGALGRGGGALEITLKMSFYHISCTSIKPVLKISFGFCDYGYASLK